jgi:hypothetical protein
MNSKLIPILALTTLAVAANAQISGIHVRAGYGWSGSIMDVNNNSRHLVGPEFGIDFPVTHLPLVDICLTGNVLLGGQVSRGSDLDGTVYRLLLSARASIPASKIGVFGGIGWATAQARSGEFGSFNGQVMQLGVAFPLGLKLPILSPTLEIAGTVASKAGLGGYSVSLGLRF